MVKMSKLGDTAYASKRKQKSVKNIIQKIQPASIISCLVKKLYVYRVQLNMYSKNKTKNNWTFCHQKKEGATESKCLQQWENGSPKFQIESEEFFGKKVLEGQHICSSSNQKKCTTNRTDN